MSDEWVAPGRVDGRPDRSSAAAAPSPDRRGTDGAPYDRVSVAALAAGVLPTGPLAVVLGVLGLVRTRTRRRRGRRLALTGIVLGLAWSAVAAVVLPSLLTPPAVEGDVAAEAVVPAERMRAGNCVRSLPVGEVVEVTLVPCDEPHTAQVVGVGTLPEDAEDPAAEAARFCRGRAEVLDESAAMVTLVTADERRAACLAEWPVAVTTDLVG